MRRIKVGVVDDQELLVSAFSALIDNQPDMRAVFTATNGQEAVDACAGNGADVVLMDIRMPVLDGVEATRRIVAAGSRPHILMLTTFNVDELVVGSIAAGARGFLLKDADSADMLDAIRAVDRGEAVVHPQSAPALLATVRGRFEEPGRSLREALTEREIEVLTLVGQGRTNPEIAVELFVAETTVKTHVGHVLMKLNARDRVALVIVAHSTGLVGGDRHVSLD